MGTSVMSVVMRHLKERELSGSFVIWVGSMSRWRKEYFCSECEEVVSWETKMGSLGLCPYCGFCSEGTVMSTGMRAVEVQPGRVRVAWTIVKLKAVRVLLVPIVRWHVRREVKKTDRLDEGGS